MLEKVIHFPRERQFYFPPPDGVRERTTQCKYYVLPENTIACIYIPYSGEHVCSPLCLDNGETREHQTQNVMFNKTFKINNNYYRGPVYCLILPLYILTPSQPQQDKFLFGT